MQGTLLLVAAWPLQVLALLLAPIAVVQPMLAAFPIPLLLFARFGLREHVTRQDLAGLAAITAGLILLVAEAPRRTVLTPFASRLALPLALVGAVALAAYAFSRAVLIALWAGLETWGGGSGRAAMLAAGLALVVTGAAILSRSGTAERAKHPSAR